MDGDARLDAVRRSVAGRVPVDERERESQRRFLAALARLPCPLDRDADPTHVTGSGIVVGPRGVLLHRHKRLGIWLQTGGHLEAAETPWGAAVRETAEETGLAVLPAERDVPLLHLDVHPGGGGHTHLDLRYLLSVEGDDHPRPPAGESQDVRWFDWDQAIAVADPGLRGLLAVLRGPPADRPAAG
jgi:8-oxo-dGTP pyrophosphatase MutT (NUDIX family)